MIVGNLNLELGDFEKAKKASKTVIFYSAVKKGKVSLQRSSSFLHFIYLNLCSAGFPLRTALVLRT